MAYAFDTLGHTKALRAAGIPMERVEAHAEDVRIVIVIWLVTKKDLRTAIETQALQMTVRLGGIVAAGFAALITLT